MYKYGLKLWSINTEAYITEAQKLFDQGVYDYVELYTVPGTLDTLLGWKSITAPFVVHAPHYKHGVNLSKPEHFEENMKILREAKTFADGLGSEHIICHGGIDGDIQETTKQLLKFNDSRVLLENKPRLIMHFEGEFCVGSRIEEIKYFKDNTDYGFCLDIGHSVAAASTFKLDPYEFAKEFLRFNPVIYHLSDTHTIAETDEHLNFTKGDLDITKILSIIPHGSLLTIETNKASKENLDDFVEDVEYLKSLNSSIIS